MYIEGLDELDNKILDMIRENARLTYKEIGEHVGISRVAVRNRMQLLEEKGIIQGYHTIIDPTKVPEGIRFVLDLEVTPDAYEDMVETLAHSKLIRQIYSISGDCRLHAVGFASNSRNMEIFANSIYREKRGVRMLSCRTVLATLMDVDGGVEYEKYQEHEHLEE